jgi:uncharacterized membrane-anchored protein
MQTFTQLLIVALLAGGTYSVQAEEGSQRSQQAVAEFRAEQQRIHGPTPVSKAAASERLLRRD